MDSSFTQDSSYYNLVATVGSSPAVVTEIIWYYAMDLDAPRYPASVTIITTNHGLERWEKQVMRTSHSKSPSPWFQLQDEVLGDKLIPLSILRPRHDGGKNHSNGLEEDFLSDITTDREDKLTANLCYSTIHRFTQPGQLPLIGSIAGGRKTMSAHMMAAFSAYARRNDELVHVLVREEDEKDPNYFFPNPGINRSESGIQCIQVPFPLLRPYLNRGLFQNIPDDPLDLQGLMDALKPFDYVDPKKASPSVKLYVGRGAWGSNLLEFPAPDGSEQGSCQLSTQNMATLLVLGEHFTKYKRSVLVADFLTPVTERCYILITQLNPTRSSYQSWKNKTQLSKAFSRLNDQLELLPVSREYLTIKGHKRARKLHSLYWEHEQSVELSVFVPPILYRRVKHTWARHFENISLREFNE